MTINANNAYNNARHNWKRLKTMGASVHQSLHTWDSHEFSDSRVNPSMPDFVHALWISDELNALCSAVWRNRPCMHASMHLVFDRFTGRVQTSMV